jgi:Pyruvate/2-oxoacid:ferredoxin oxidoreductase delta subunit
MADADAHCQPYSPMRIVLGGDALVFLSWRVLGIVVQRRAMYRVLRTCARHYFFLCKGCPVMVIHAWDGVFTHEKQSRKVCLKSGRCKGCNLCLLRPLGRGVGRPHRRLRCASILCVSTREVAEESAACS